MLKSASKPLLILGLLITLVFSGWAPAQADSGNDIDSLKNEIESLKKGQEGIKKDLDEIKKLLKQRPARRGRQNTPFKPTDLSIKGSPFLGQADAPVTLVEFTDYQCPFCKRHSTQVMPQIVKEYVDAGKVKYVLREFPIRSLHPNAIKASHAALCASDQGQYWQMHDRIFAAPRNLEPKDITAHAEALGLDTTTFQACIDSNKYAQKISGDLSDGSKVGVRGTPSFLFGRTDKGDLDKIKATKFLRGAQGFPQFKRVIDELLAPAKEEKKS